MNKKEYTYRDFLKEEESKTESGGSSNYGAYKPSAAVEQAQNKLNQHVGNKPQAYTSQWQASLNDTLNKILNREKFTYDLNGDALYQQYKNQYVNLGQQAMMDTMGQAQSMTGGYGNSYAQTAGQQAYHGYLQQLNDKVPELYQLALNQYNREGDDLYNRYGLYADREALDYGRYRDQVGDYNTELERLTNDARYQSETDYNRYMDQYNNWLSQYNLSYGQYRDQVADRQWQAEFDEAIRQYNIANGIATGTAASGIGGSTGGTGTGTGFTNNALAAQRFLNQNGANLAEDGVWGSKSAAAAKAMGYNSLDEVMSALGISDDTTGAEPNVEAEYYARAMTTAGESKDAILNYLGDKRRTGEITQDEYNRLTWFYVNLG